MLWVGAVFHVVFAPVSAGSVVIDSSPCIALRP
jgi:hypothetical protein